MDSLGERGKLILFSTGVYHPGGWPKDGKV
jgi:hypothetical protein